MTNKERKNQLRKERKRRRSRAKIFGTEARPRLHVFRSNKNISAQIIDDTKAKTLVSAHSREVKEEKSTKTQQAESLGKILAQKARKQGVKKVVFDRSGFRYHGRVKALADAARAGGLEF